MARTVEQEEVWQAARQVVLERDGRRCVECGATADLHVHHVVPQASAGSDDPANLISLCSGCHAARHPYLQVRLARRAIERWAVRIARSLDRAGDIPADGPDLALALRLFGVDRFRAGQLEVVLAALRGESLLVVRPTGSGKTLCFQLPALLRPGTAVVISPLKALMVDQVTALQRAHIPGTYINGDITGEERRQRYALMDKLAWKLLYLTPERFDPTMVRDASEIARIAAVRPNFLVVDEAHCVDRWGDDFCPNYGRLGAVRETLGGPPVLAFTATAGVGVQGHIVASLGIPAANVFISGVDRPNIALVRKALRDDDPERCRIIARLIRRHAGTGKVMVFVPTRKVGCMVSDGLKAAGLDAPFYHGQLPREQREELLARFTGRNAPTLDAVVCTNAFGMGIDVPNVRAVVHWVQPASVEDYLQEFGRAGRDGQPALAVVFKRPGDTGVLEFMAKKTAEEAAQDGRDGSAALKAKVGRITELDKMIGRQTCFRKQIVAYFEGTAPPRRRSLALRILAKVFSRTEHTGKAAFCCDKCDREKAARILGTP